MSKILAHAKESQELFVVQDQKGNPTYTRDFAATVHSMIGKINKDNEKMVLNSIYHVTNRGVASRYEVACELLRQAHLEHVKVIPIDSTELRSLAKRPLSSTLDNTRFEKTFGVVLRPWQEALSDYLKEVQCQAQTLKSANI